LKLTEKGSEREIARKMWLFQMSSSKIPKERRHLKRFSRSNAPVSVFALLNLVRFAHPLPHPFY